MRGIFICLLVLATFALVGAGVYLYSKKKLSTEVGPEGGGRAVSPSELLSGFFVPAAPKPLPSDAPPSAPPAPELRYPRARPRQTHRPPSVRVVSIPTPRPRVPSKSRVEIEQLSDGEEDGGSDTYVHPLNRTRVYTEPLEQIGRRRIKGVKRRSDGEESAPLGEDVYEEDYDMTHHLPPEDIKIFPVPADGDCFFHCARMALEALGVERSVWQLRVTVARNVGQEEFEFLKSITQAANKDHSLLSDYSFAKKARNVKELRSAMLTREYFGDEMAIRALEAVFCVKFIVLQALPSGRIRMARGDHLRDEEQTFKWHAILYLNLASQHYELVGYKGNQVFKANELPPKVQRLLAQEHRQRAAKAEKNKENHTEQEGSTEEGAEAAQGSVVVEDPFERAERNGIVRRKRHGRDA